MGMRMPETCWAVFKWQVINLRSCCIWLVDFVESVMMQGLANPKKAVLICKWRPQMSELRHIFKCFATYLYVLIFYPALCSWDMNTHLVSPAFIWPATFKNSDTLSSRYALRHVAGDAKCQTAWQLWYSAVPLTPRHFCPSICNFPQQENDQHCSCGQS